MAFVILLAELGVLFWLSRILIQKIYTFFFKIFHSSKVALSLTLVLMFPGTVIHELSHLFTAEILGVPTGKLKLAPEALEDINKNGVTAGSVAIARTDPLRRNLIGLAPIFTGIIALATISYFINWSNLPAGRQGWLNWVIFYLMFSVSNSMFSSKEDLKEFLPFAILITLIFGAAYFAGINLVLTGPALDFSLKILNTLVGSLGLVLGINITLLLILSI